MIPLKMQRPLASAIALILLLFAVFHAVPGAEVSLIDDEGMINDIANANLSLQGIFFPRALEAGYYRPVIGLSYFVDKYLWGMDSRAMHLENLLLHAVNTVLLYFLARKILKRFPGSDSFALAAAALFGVHPVTVESVAWISGRTDILATVFVLSSAICIWSYKESGRKIFLWAAALLLVPGVLAKEVAFFFTLAALAILRANPDDEPPAEFPLVLLAAVGSVTIALVITTGIHWFVLPGAAIFWLLSGRPDLKTRAGVLAVCRTGVTVAAVLGISVGAFFALRKIAYASDISKIGETLILMTADPNYTLHLFLGGAGFYAKKFIFPLPLNFFIREIDPLYSLGGVCVVLTGMYAWTRRTTASAFYIAGIAMFLPVLPFTFGTIAWTAYAERYIYTSSAFWSLALASLAIQIAARSRIPRMGTALLAAGGAAVLSAALVSSARSETWRTNLVLIENTMRQTPEMKVLRGIYMAALVRKGMLEEAKEQYRIASTLTEHRYRAIYELQMAAIMLREGKGAEAERLVRETIRKSNGKDVTTYQSLSGILKGKLAVARDPSEKRAIAGELLETDRMIYKLTGDPHVQYRMGQVALEAGSRSEALDYFSRAASLLPESIEKKSAEKIAEQLRRELKEKGAAQ